eukprot:m.759332 g.759332  ORF g.759332 m.759332 type:complete len:949 (+) comp23195_c0_seq4:179-3025(+)
MDSIVAGLLSTAPAATQYVRSLSVNSFQRFQHEIDRHARNGTSLSLDRWNKLLGACITCLISPIADNRQKLLARNTVSSWTNHQPQMIASGIVTTFRSPNDVSNDVSSSTFMFPTLFGNAICENGLASGRDILFALKTNCTSQEWDCVVRAVSSNISKLCQDVRGAGDSIPLEVMELLAWNLIEYPDLLVHIPDSSALRHVSLLSVVSHVTETYPLNADSSSPLDASLDTGESDVMTDIDPVRQRALTMIGKLLRNLWSNADFDSLAPEMLPVMKLLVSPTCRKHSTYITWMLAYMPAGKVQKVTYLLVRKDDYSEDDLTIISCRFVRWVALDSSTLAQAYATTFRGTCNEIFSHTLWGTRMIQCLSAHQRGGILGHVAERTVPFLMECLSRHRSKPQHMSTVLLLNQLLSGYQHSSKLFLSIAPQLPDLIIRHQEGTATRDVVAVVLSRLVHLMIHIHGRSDIPKDILAALDRALEAFPDIPVDQLNAIQQRTLHRSSVASESSNDRQARGEFRSGLLNLGNTCYINSIVQGMLSLHVFVRSILHHSTTAKGLVSKECMKLFAFLHHSTRRAVNPRTFVDACRPSWFAPGTQQDASELWVHLLDRLEREEEHDGSPADAASLEGAHAGSPARIQAETARDHLAVATADSTQLPPSKCFRGELQTISRCAACGLESRRQDAFNQISLAFSDECLVGASARDTVEDMLDRYLKVEVLDGKNQYDCTHCGLQNGSRKFSVACAPPCLVLTLSCFKYNPATGTRSKLLADVAPPLVLNLPVLHRAQKDSLDDSQGGTLREDSVLKKYHLKAVVVHRGASPNSGHYYTYGCTRHDAAEWCVFNDDIVQPAAQDVLLTSAKVTKATPYMLMYVSDDTIRLSGIPLPVVPPAVMALVQVDNSASDREENIRRRAPAASTPMPSAPSRYSRYPHPDEDEGSQGSSGLGSSLPYII